MKKKFILSVFIVFGIAIFLTSCGPSRVYATKEKTQRMPPPSPVYPAADRYQVSATLILSPTPGFRMNQHSDGRYYHRSPNGFTYWKGFDNRFYLDKAFINRVTYNKWEYKEWKKYSKQKNNKYKKY